MLNGRDTHVALAEHCAALGVNHILCNRINHGLTIDVDTLNLITGILWCRIEGNSQVQTCMQSFSEQGKTAL